MGAHSNAADRKRGRSRTVLAAAFAAGALAITGAGVYAGLNATATGTETVSSGTLSLNLASEGGSAGFPQTVSNMAPGDTYNTFVTLTNGDSLAGQSLTLGVTGTGSTLLTTNGTKGLAVSVDGCSVAWVVTPGTPGTATCGPVGTPGTVTPMLASTPVATLSTTPGSLVAGAVANSAAYHLRVSVALPNQDETTTNGILPTPTSIQNLSTTLTYTFTEAQRDGTTTNA